MRVKNSVGIAPTECTLAPFIQTPILLAFWVITSPKVAENHGHVIQCLEHNHPGICRSLDLLAG
jgi:hypothetical protein